MTLSDMIVAMSAGRIEHVGIPRDLYGEHEEPWGADERLSMVGCAHGR